MSHASEIFKSPDDAIYAYPPRESGICDYRIGRDISVSWRGLKNGPERQYLCNHCRVNDCCHTRRVDKWRGENFG